MHGSSKLPCPACGKHVELVPSTGAFVQHPPQPKRGKKWEPVCPASGIIGGRLLVGGAFAPRDRAEVRKDLNAKLGVTPEPKDTSKSSKRKTVVVKVSKSVRTVRGGLPSLGKRR